jgi:uncharacterized protein YndB with AHSA1/START domain
MADPKVIHDTFVIERSFPKPPETVFAAFSDTARFRRWFGEGDHHTVEVFTQDFRVGGVQNLTYRLNEGTPFPGVAITNEGRFQEIVPGKRIVTASTMDLGGTRISASQVTIELLHTNSGTDLICTHQGAFFEGSGGPQMRKDGWISLIDKLANELEK